MPAPSFLPANHFEGVAVGTSTIDLLAHCFPDPLPQAKGYLATWDCSATIS